MPLLRRRWVVGGAFACSLLAGCTAAREPIPEGALIRHPLPTPVLPPPKPPDPLPEPPPDPAKARAGAADPPPLALAEVLASVQHFFPLLLAVEQEREVAAGQRLAAEGGFDPLFRSRYQEQAGTFSNTQVDVGVEQALGAGGVSSFAGWRLGVGNFPIYYNERKTGQGGEFRAGLTVPLLQNRDIDPRRARLRAAQIQERLADPAIVRARLDFFRTAAQAYWAWQAAGAQYRVTDELVRLAERRQGLFDAQRAGGEIDATLPTLNRRILTGREEARLAAERVVQQAAVRLSLFVRDGAGDPVVPPSGWLAAGFLELEPPPPAADRLPQDVADALDRRPELVRFRLEKERRAVELQLSTNQLLPALNTFGSVAQEAGFAKKTATGEGPFTTDRTIADAGLVFEMPLPFRNARGLTRTARAQLAQLLAQERYARDDIAAQVQDAVSELDLTFKRVDRAREEVRQAAKVLALEANRRQAGQTDLVVLNLQEIAAAEAQARVAATLGLYFAAVANYRAAIGVADPSPGVGGRVLPVPDPVPAAGPGRELPPPAKLP